ncbi:NADPH:quinone reductase [Geomesophilobacter sediminis]|uniref:NADPH:quinone reductase n=1 Tax=Geomesophilobacter sediminis TaxID=2798584 RepID=A0A8J7IZU9_9BACT|nr:NADPH:quinone reductase [Geomesophilobacter sediminis]MBJ6725672.1 NADPH:quinone reductase [Geomesophilobacter sediminis]
MKAIIVRQLGEPEVMRIEEIPDPVPGPGEVLVRIRAAGVNPVDCYIRSGLYAGRAELPYTPGIDGAGIVEAVGAGVTHRKVGERVYLSWPLTGTYAEKVLCREFQTHPLPERVNFAQGAAIGVPYGAAYRALFQRGHAVAGESVLIHGGSGGVGTAAIQLARAAGLRVIATAGSEKGLRQIQELGAHVALNHHDPGHLEQVREATCGRGADLILEMLANVNLSHDLGILARGGRVMVIGSRGRVEIDPRELLGDERSIVGITLFGLSEADSRSMHAAFIAGLETGTLRPVVSRDFPLSDAARAHHEILETSSFGKLVLIP